MPGNADKRAPVLSILCCARRMHVVRGPMTCARMPFLRLSGRHPCDCHIVGEVHWIHRGQVQVVLTLRMVCGSP